MFIKYLQGAQVSPCEYVTGISITKKTQLLTFADSPNSQHTLPFAFQQVGHGNRSSRHCGASLRALFNLALQNKTSLSFYQESMHGLLFTSLSKDEGGHMSTHKKYNDKKNTTVHNWTCDWRKQSLIVSVFISSACGFQRCQQRITHTAG